MNNKKGYTLIEVIVSILVLSIASIMLLSGIKSVIHFMSASNNLKNASDAMFGKAEGIEDETITGKVSETTSEKISYKVNGLPVEGYVKAFQSRQYKDISLKQLFDKAGDKLNTMGLYKDETIGITDNFFGFFNNHLDKFCFGSVDTCPVFGISKGDSLKSFEGVDYRYPIFPEKLLPNSLREPPDNEKTSHYIRVNLPWEYGNGRDPMISSGGILLFLSLIENNRYAESKYPVASSEKINFVYDYNNQIWYYHPDTTQGLTYGLRYNRNYIEDLNSSNIVVSNGTSIKSWEAFYKHIKEPSNGWLYLDGNMTYDESADPLKYWTPVK